jgi:hypothetical protein
MVPIAGELMRLVLKWQTIIYYWVENDFDGHVGLTPAPIVASKKAHFQASGSRMKT